MSEVGDNTSDTYLVTQVTGGQIFGIKYIGSEQGNETVDLDQTVSYKKVECPDTKHPDSSS